MKNKKYKLVGACPWNGTTEDIKKLISKYFCGTQVFLGEVSEDVYFVYNTTKVIQGFRVINKKGRSRFEMEIPS